MQPSVTQPVQASRLVDQAAPQLLWRDLQHIIYLRIGEAPGAAPQLACKPTQALSLLSETVHITRNPSLRRGLFDVCHGQNSSGIPLVHSVAAYHCLEISRLVALPGWHTAVRCEEGNAIKIETAILPGR